MIILEETAKAKKEVTSLDNSSFLSSRDNILASAGHNLNNNYSGCDNSARIGQHNSWGRTGEDTLVKVEVSLSRNNNTGLHLSISNSRGHIHGNHGKIHHVPIW